MTFAIESRIKSVARTRVTSNSVFSNPRRVRKTAESLPKVEPNPLVLDCMRMMTISSTDSRIWAACRYGAKGYLLPISVMAGVRLPIIAYAGRTGRWGPAPILLTVRRDLTFLSGSLYPTPIAADCLRHILLRGSIRSRFG